MYGGSLTNGFADVVRDRFGMAPAIARLLCSSCFRNNTDLNNTVVFDGKLRRAVAIREWETDDLN